MPINNLHEFINSLESKGELSRISAPVDPFLEIAAITDRMCKRTGGGTALLFEHPLGSDFPVATNLFGSKKRLNQALGVTELSELTARMSGLLDRIPAFDINHLGRQIADLSEFKRFAPLAGSEPDPSLLRMEPLNLQSFPFLQSWPGDGEASGHQRYITLPQVFTTDPDGGTYNCGVYRVQLRGEREAAIQWKAGSGAFRHAELYRRAEKAMPVAIVLGGDPAMLFSAMFRLPGDLNETTFAGFLRGAPLVTGPCRSVPLLVPEGAEVVIEGYVEPGESVTEGPFGNHTGLYAPAAPAALLRITTIRHRADAIIPATVVGPPPMEDCRMALAWERLLLAFLHKLVPSITDIHFPPEWVFHQSAIISLEPPRPGMIRNIARQLWDLEWFAAARIIIFVAAGTAPLNLNQAAWKTINLTSFTDDIFRDTETGRIALDATASRVACRELQGSPECTDLVRKRWKEYGLV